ncbi:MAG TPA: PDZ domain-containing protein [Thermoanaerobaculia bacterium]|nr:PDZ domain-containing protein [Thermoanaerobaculia bacterium]HXT49712.1 PDZ domain-containing protein [Thermoanaerobaculia bacterium]
MSYRQSLSISTRRRRVCAVAAFLLAAAALPALAAASSSESSRDDTRVRERAVVRARTPRPLLLTGKRGFLGVDLLELTPELRRHFQAGDDAGVLVAHVESGSPAANAGLAVGDVLVSIDGKPVKSSWSLRDLIAPRKAGDEVTLSVVRDGARRELVATLVEREGQILEMGKLMKGHLMPGEDGDDTVVVIPNAKDWEKFGEEMGRWGEQFGAEVAEAFADPDVRLRIEHEVGERATLQRKIEALERRLHDLEKRLAEQHR